VRARASVGLPVSRWVPVPTAERSTSLKDLRVSTTLPSVATAAATSSPDKGTKRVGTRQHYLALDGLRGAAVLAVFLYHFGGGSHAPTTLPVRLYLIVVHSGWLGVDLFFVLSGFLITGILYDTAHKDSRIKNFYARRALRIFPLFYGVLFGFLLLTPVLHLHWQAGHAFYFLYLYNMMPWLAPNLGSPGPAMMLNHFWSLSVEEQFYLLWPFVVWFVPDRRKLLWIAVALMAFALGSRLYIVLYVGTQDTMLGLLQTRADSLLFGAAVALLVRGPSGRSLPATPVAIVSGLLSLLVLWRGQISFHHSQLIGTVGYTTIGIFFSCIVYWAQTEENWVTRIFSASFLRFFGRYSYGLYVYQGLLMIFIIPYVHTVQRLVHSEAIGGVLFIFLALGLLVSISMLSFHLFEEPILRLKKHFN
jgi:peptidoglycan/LPS O-acetylase OafA/YrhL